MCAQGSPSGSGHKRGYNSRTSLIYRSVLPPYSPLRREGRTASAEPVCSCAFLFAHFCTCDRGCSAHLVFPASLLFFGANAMQTSGKRCRENAVVRHHPRMRMIQYPRSL
jgi:hypothetical protein